MERSPFKSRPLVDFLFDFSAGVNAGIAPILLQADQLGYGSNRTVRRSFVTHRPPVKQITLEVDSYAGQATLDDFQNGLFQGAQVYNPDNGIDSLMAMISGRLFKLEITGSTAALTDVSIQGDLNDPTQLRAWMWQAEKWMIITDGTNASPIFYDSTASPTTRRSNGNTNITYASTLTAAFTVQQPGVLTAPFIHLATPFTGKNGDIINLNPVGGFRVISGEGTLDLEVDNYNATPIGATVAAGNQATWTAGGNELPPGRMAAYGLGRNWLCLVDGKQFVASDLVGGSSGTLANNFRDAVLNVTENNYLLGGGYFTIPGSYGEIRAFCFAETIDSSLGQGALQVFTDRNIFSCNAPVDRLTWQDLTNPILTESAKGGGGLSQWSTVNVNSDIMSRARDGIRSLTLTRREFNTWGNVPISREVQPQLDRDSDDLLRFTSAVVFDNRGLMLTEGVLNTERGNYFKRIIPLNYDPNSSLRGKEPSIYDALFWQGLNIFKIVRGTFNNNERCFLFTLNNTTAKIELWELLPSATTEIYDAVDSRIVWSFEAFLDFGQKNPAVRDRLRLDEAEIYIDELRGIVDFQAYWAPDSWPCWIPWHSWQECEDNTIATETQPGFRPNMGLGEPDPTPCDPTNNRPLREGYTFRFKLVVTGHCRFMGGKFGAVTVPQPEWAKPSCNQICFPAI